MASGRKRQLFFGILAAIGLFAAAGILIFPSYSETQEEATGRYFCIWENGKEEYLRFDEAIPLIKGIKTDAILLEKEGLTGIVETGEGYTECIKALSGGEAARLFSLDGSGMSSLEKTAVFERFKDTGFYAGEFFAWNGERVSFDEIREYKEVYLLEGVLKTGILAQTGAEKLILKASAELTASALIGSCVKEIEAEPPYLIEGGAVYQTSGKIKRLVAAFPFAEELVIDCDFLDEGALAPCVALKRLKLPENYQGTLKMLFGAMPVPEELKVF